MVLLQTEVLERAPHAHMLAVRACNRAGLCSETHASADALVLVADAPFGGRVSLGVEGPTGFFLASESSLAVSWDGFDDTTAQAAATRNAPNMSVPLRYELCLGTTPMGCQTQPFVDVGNSTNWSSNALQLRCGAIYFAVARATNCAGLQHTVASKGAKLCCQPPTGVAVAIVDRTGAELHSVGNDSRPLITWDPFIDSCSGVQQYSVSLRRIGTTAAALWTSAATTQLFVALPQSVLPQLEHALRYEAVVTATSHAGLLGTVWSPALAFDRTAPSISALQLRWGPTADWREVHSSECVSSEARAVEQHVESAIFVVA